MTKPSQVIGYPGDRPPMVCPPPCDYKGATWTYRQATKTEAQRALRHHWEVWPDWGPDPELVRLAE